MKPFFWVINIFSSLVNYYTYSTDISALLEKWDDPNMDQDQGVAQVVRQLDQACREAGFFYVVTWLYQFNFTVQYFILFLREILNLYSLFYAKSINFILVFSFWYCVIQDDYELLLCFYFAVFAYTDDTVLMQKGHGIPDSLVKEIRSISHKFFDLPYEEKVKIKLSAATGYRFLFCDTTSL